MNEQIGVGKDALAVVEKGTTTIAGKSLGYLCSVEGCKHDGGT